MLKDPNFNHRGSAVTALAELGAKEEVPQIAKLLQDQDPFVREDAITALSRLGAKEQVPQIAELLIDPDLLVRAAVRALGNIGAKHVPQIVDVLKDPEYKVRFAAIEVLGQLAAKEQAPQIGKLLKDRDPHIRATAVWALDPYPQVRGAAFRVLGQLGAKEYMARIIRKGGEEADINVGRAAGTAMLKLGPLDLEGILHVLDWSYRYPILTPHGLSRAHVLGGGDIKIERTIAFLGRQPGGIEIPVSRLSADPEEARATLEVFKEAWDLSEDMPQLRQDLARTIATVANDVPWDVSDVPLLRHHEQNLRKSRLAEAKTVQLVIRSFETRNWLGVGGKVWLVHGLFWLVMIRMYPRFPQVQAIVFWNPWVRKILGLGYVGLLLTWCPSLRAILLAPFEGFAARGCGP